MARRKRKSRIRIRQSARLVSKTDKTMVHKPDTTRYPRMNAQMPRTTGVVFKVKIKKKQ